MNGKVARTAPDRFVVHVEISRTSQRSIFLSDRSFVLDLAPRGVDAFFRPRLAQGVSGRSNGLTKRIKDRAALPLNRSGSFFSVV